MDSKFLRDLENDSVDSDLLDDELNALEHLPISKREKVVKFLQSNPMQILLCVIVLLDAGIVIAQILLDLNSVKENEQSATIKKSANTLINFTLESSDKILYLLQRKEKLKLFIPIVKLHKRESQLKGLVNFIRRNHPDKLGHYHGHNIDRILHIIKEDGDNNYSEQHFQHADHPQLHLTNVNFYSPNHHTNLFTTKIPFRTFPLRLQKSGSSAGTTHATTATIFMNDNDHNFEHFINAKNSHELNKRQSIFTKISISNADYEFVPAIRDDLSYSYNEFQRAASNNILNDGQQHSDNFNKNTTEEITNKGNNENHDDDDDDDDDDEDDDGDQFADMDDGYDEDDNNDVYTNDIINNKTAAKNAPIIFEKLSIKHHEEDDDNKMMRDNNIDNTDNNNNTNNNATNLKSNNDNNQTSQQHNPRADLQQKQQQQQQQQHLATNNNYNHYHYDDDEEEDDGEDTLRKVAHGLHYASIGLLGFLVIEVTNTFTMSFFATTNQ
ncbi:hypothetical protein HELRODRAFT_161500 [Helobdella robusta]|uniref:Uncharacterized protein n=1 Tax=Helobdella robusta TaxID=6412 RepID=T1ERK1_HELRO|nr:hypothetical protein HELRODRAFT_161500 [Helobdella robusta]ESO02254.1 hypothetical protein HELRODRAFT_161500 [Helobdella robusta]